MPARLEAVRLPKAAEIVARTLRRKIVTHELQAGDPLPPEDQLMAEMAVARTTVREALRILESEGLVVVRRGAGGGARIRTPAVPMVARYIGLLLQYEGATVEDVHRARVMLEAPAAGLLAERSDPAVVEALRAALADEAAAIDDPATLSRAHGRFHQRVVQLTDSHTYDALSAVANRIIQAQADRFVAAHGAEEATLEGLATAHRAHARLVDLIAAGAAQDAEDLWRRHLEAGDAHLLSDPGAHSVLDLLE
ncbi:FadR/GntR family transcriptional regulator [Pseudonocardia sp. GCM10023141]|uniref:FadR/GntR family transcriptional regulator n=1 Tax=Pseudonocardia sp. GCM10023141 TaxID=3252653 RepID=UPI003605C1B7